MASVSNKPALSAPTSVKSALPAFLPGAGNNNPADVREDHSPTDPNFRWQGPDTTAEKSADAGIRTRQNQFKTVEEFGAWRLSKGMPPLDHWNLVMAWARFKGEPTTERAVLNPILEQR